MAQAIWQFVSNTGFKHKIGVYHGDKSGHLLIYCDTRVVKIDFSVLEPYQFSFFVDDEFCEVTIHKEANGSFTYDFQVDKQADTPLNQERKKEAKINIKWLSLIVFGMISIVIAFYFGMTQYQKHLAEQNSGWAGVIYVPNKKEATFLHSQGKKATAKLFDGDVLTYTFLTETGQTINGKIAWPDNQAPLHLLPSGFSLEPGDQYQVRYNGNNPKVHMIDFLAPTPEQVSVLAARAARVEARKHGGTVTEADRCLIQTIVEETGWESLRLVLFQFVTPSANSLSNSDAYLRLLREPKMEAAIKERCWDKPQ
jgi:hypothetical protein